MKDRCSRDLRPDVGGEQRRNQVGALDPDVEQPHLETDRHGESRDEKRDGVVDRDDERLGGGPENPHLLVGSEGVDADQQQGDGGEAEGDDEGDRRRHDRGKEPPGLHDAFFSPAPVMYDPRISGVISDGSSFATSLPSKRT